MKRELGSFYADNKKIPGQMYLDHPLVVDFSTDISPSSEHVILDGSHAKSDI